MHFWIDKHSQTCGFSGRHRVPTSLSSSGGGGRRWRGAKPMVTPVHRFQPIECVTGQYSHNHGGRRNNSNSGERELPVRAHAVELDSSVFLDLPLDGSTEATGHSPPQIDPVNKHKCGVTLSFAILTAGICIVRLYFQGQGLEYMFLLGLIMLISLCAMVMYHSKTKHNIFSSSAAAAAAVSAARVPPQPSLIAQVRVTSVVEDTPPPAPLPLVEPPPPPYDIAILLPQQIRQEDIPPPSYEKAVS